MNIEVRIELIFENFDFSAFFDPFWAKFSPFFRIEAKFPPKIAATCLEITMFKIGICTHLDISNICHLAKNLSFLTTWCPEKLAQNFQKVIF